MELGLSQTALGSHVGITFQQIQKYEKGVNRIGASRLLAIAGVLQVPVAYFFPDEPIGKEVESGPAEVLELLSQPGALDLLRDFARISDRAVRKALIAMAKALAAKHGAAAPPPPH
jgi:transcriptional regulator with XRE-family HTH domain